MGLLSIFRRQVDARTPPAQAAASDAADAVQQARTRARQRLIGAVVLVGIGIIGFPLVFETQPRPIPVDIPIEIPRKDAAPALVMPPARAPGLTGAGAGAGAAPDAAGGAVAGADRSGGVASARPAPDLPPAAARDDIITESKDEAGRERNADAPLPEARQASNAGAGAGAGPKVDHKPTAAVADGARARALLEGREASPTAATAANTTATAIAVTAPRFVVQVGAFADADAARETRLKVEKLGLKTYTQVAETPSGSRIRVRVGPFATRDEADKAQARARSAGLGAVVLTL